MIPRWALTRHVGDSWLDIDRRLRSQCALSCLGVSASSVNGALGSCGRPAREFVLLIDRVLIGLLYSLELTDDWREA